MPTCADMCRHVLICADMCQHVASLSAPLIPTICVVPYLQAGMCQHTWTCRHVPTGAEMCRHVLICASMCQHVTSLSLWYQPFRPDLHSCMCQHMWTHRHVLICGSMLHHSRNLWYQPFGPYFLSWRVSVHMDMPICGDKCPHVLTCVDMCRYVPTCEATLITSDTNHLDLISLLACVSTCGHADMCWYVPTCADACQHVASHRENVPSAKLPQMKMRSWGNGPNFSSTPIWPGYPLLGCYQYRQPIVGGSLWWRLWSNAIN